MNLVRTQDAKWIAQLNEPVQNLHHALYPNVFKPYDFNVVYAYFLNVIDKAHHHFIVCMDGERPVGYIWYEEVRREETAFSSARHYLYINQISVIKSQRGKGVGTALFSHVRAFAEQHNIHKIGLDYWVKNTSAKKIYEKLGFELEKEVAYLTL